METRFSADTAIAKSPIIIGCLWIAVCCLFACKNKPNQAQTREKKDYIKRIQGVNDSIPASIARKGEVLISYSDCNICHKEGEKSVGPSFQDIGKRYPANSFYIEMLAHRVLQGGSGSWGYPVMDPHPNLSLEDAKLMVSYILSLKT